MVDLNDVPGVLREALRAQLSALGVTLTDDQLRAIALDAARKLYAHSKES